MSYIMKNQCFINIIYQIERKYLGIRDTFVLNSNRIFIHKIIYILALKLQFLKQYISTPIGTRVFYLLRIDLLLVEQGSLSTR